MWQFSDTSIFNTLGGAGAVLLTSWLLIDYLIIWVSEVLREFSPPSACHVSPVTWRVSRVTCQLLFCFIFLNKGVKLVWMVFYQWGLPGPDLVLFTKGGGLLEIFEILDFLLNKKWTQTWNNFPTWTLLSIFSLVNCPNFVLILCRKLKRVVNFQIISINPASLVSWNSLTNIFLPKNKGVCKLSKYMFLWRI